MPGQIKHLISVILAASKNWHRRYIWRALIFGLPGILALGAPLPGDTPWSTADARPFGVGDTLLGIISYLRWSSAPNPIRLCVVGTTEYSADIALAIESTMLKRPVVFTSRTIDQITSDECNVMYIGNISEDGWHKLYSRIGSNAILTVGERSDMCQLGSMFCLDIQPDVNTRFKVNLDSIARSGLHVHPQVLRLRRTPRKTE